MSYANDDYIKKYQPLWDSWNIEKFVGQGSYGRVYKISKMEWGYKYESALKVMSIPTNEQYHQAVSTLGNDEQQLKRYFEDMVKGIIGEIVLLYNLRGNSNIVSYEDHAVKRHEDELAWDILIRMEYLTPLNKYLDERELSVDDVINIGLDICTALDVCAKRSIVHRDIKDENIFVSGDKRYKLGDFGIARELSKGLSSSIRGTPLYIAPEVYKGLTYDTRADLYSLGILLYKLLNNGRFPFMPPAAVELRVRDSEIAVEKRLSGERMLPPCNAHSKLGETVLKLCEYMPEKRYATPASFKDALVKACYDIPYIERQRIVLSNKRETVIVPETVLLKANESVQPANLSGNIANGGLVCSEGDTLYMASPAIMHGIYSFGLDEAKASELTSDEGWFLNVADGGVYYCNSSDNEHVYYIGFDGRGRRRVLNQSAWYLNVYSGWMYYCNGSDGYCIYKVKSDATEQKKLSHYGAFNLSLCNGILYFCNKGDGCKIYRVNTDGADLKKLCDDEVGCFCIDGRNIYYVNKNDSMRLYKMNLQGAERQLLCDDMASNLNAYRGNVFYCNKGDKSRLYSIGCDGSNRQRLNDDYSDYITIVNGVIYYSNKGDEGKIYRMELDGTNRTVMNIDECADEDWIFI